MYAASARVGENILNPNPILKCTQNNDRFTVSGDLGNGALTYPIGLITADEVVMAGGKFKNSNSSYYLYIGSRHYWTISPQQGGYYSYVMSINTEGILEIDYYVSYIDKGVRPVISISPSTIKYGNGTSTNPFRLTESI